MMMMMMMKHVTSAYKVSQQLRCQWTTWPGRITGRYSREREMMYSPAQTPETSVDDTSSYHLAAPRIILLSSSYIPCDMTVIKIFLTVSYTHGRWYLSAWVTKYRVHRTELSRFDGAELSLCQGRCLSPSALASQSMAATLESKHEQHKKIVPESFPVPTFFLSRSRSAGGRV